MMQTFESWNQLGKGTHLSDMVHEPFTELFKEGVFWSTLHGTSLKKKEWKINHQLKRNLWFLQFSLKSLVGIKFQYVDVDFIVAELKKGSTAISQKWHKDHISHLRP